MNKKLLLVIAFFVTVTAQAQNKWIKVNTRVSGTMETFTLYKKQVDNTFAAVRSKEEDSGTWTFDSLDAGIYRVHVDIAYNKYLPTWHPMKALWNEAADIDLSATDSFKCEEGMIPNPVFTGPGSISGSLTEGLLKAQGDPLKNVRVVLLSSTDVIVKMVNTNDSGKFVASNLPVGTYRIRTDVVNTVDANPRTVTLDSTNATATISITVHKTGNLNTSMKETATTHIHVYPNPAHDKVMISGNVSAYTIYNLEGRQVQSGRIGPDNQEISAAGLSNGLYLMLLESADGITRVKLQKN